MTDNLPSLYNIYIIYIIYIRIIYIYIYIYIYINKGSSQNVFIEMLFVFSLSNIYICYSSSSPLSSTITTTIQ